MTEIDGDIEKYINEMIDGRNEFNNCKNEKSLMNCLEKYSDILIKTLRNLDGYRMFKREADEYYENYRWINFENAIYADNKNELNDKIRNLNELVERVITKYNAMKQTGGKRKRRKSKKINRKIRKSRKNRKTKK